MTSRDIAHQRLVNQQISDPGFTGPVELLDWMGCIQAQDYAAAKWAIGCRVKKTTDAEIDRLFNEGKILRTHVLRPTWHFVSPNDIHWMLTLTAPRIKALCSIEHRKLGIDDRILKRSRSILTRALDKNKRMTRQDLGLLLEKEKIKTEEGRIGLLLMDAELDGLICGGGRHEKQFAYMLLEDAARKTNAYSRDEAIAALAKRYFLSRGPATLKDFSWWSGLNGKDARAGVDGNSETLYQETINGCKYWFGSKSQIAKPGNKSIYLLPAFDEYAVGYKERKDVLDPTFYSAAGSGLKPIIVRDGLIIGTWRRTEKKGKTSIETNPFGKAAPVSARTGPTFAGAGPVSAKDALPAYKKYSEFSGNKLQP